MMNTTKRFWPVHRWVADRMGYTISGVSLLRNGQRQPTVETMGEIERAFDWSSSDQIRAFRDGTFVQQFNQRLAELAGPEED